MKISYKKNRNISVHQFVMPIKSNVSALCLIECHSSIILWFTQRSPITNGQSVPPLPFARPRLRRYHHHTGQRTSASVPCIYSRRRNHGRSPLNIFPGWWFFQFGYCSNSNRSGRSQPQSRKPKPGGADPSRAPQKSSYLDRSDGFEMERSQQVIRIGRSPPSYTQAVPRDHSSRNPLTLWPSDPLTLWPSDPLTDITWSGGPSDDDFLSWLDFCHSWQKQ